MAAANSEMRLVIAGAGGRMGRTLVQAIADQGCYAGRRAGRRALADDRLGSGELAGLGAEWHQAHGRRRGR